MREALPLLHDLLLIVVADLAVVLHDVTEPRSLGILKGVGGVLLEGGQALLVRVAQRLSHGVHARVLVLEVKFWLQLLHLPGNCYLGAAANLGASSNLTL